MLMPLSVGLTDEVSDELRLEGLEEAPNAIIDGHQNEKSNTEAPKVENDDFSIGTGRKSIRETVHDADKDLFA